MNLSAQFRNYLLSQKCSPVTVKNYVADVNHFVAWFEKELNTTFSPELVTSQTIEYYRKANSGTLSASSLDRHVSSLRKFFKFLKLESIISYDPIPNGNVEKIIDPDPWHLKEFKDFLYVYNASGLTIKNYLLDVKQFLRWLEEVSASGTAWKLEDQNLLRKINSEVLEEYKNRLLRSSLNEAGFSPRSVNRKLSSLRKYLYWLREAGHLPQGNNHGLLNIPTTRSLMQKPSQVRPANNPISYSKFPPVRVGQKLFRGSNFLLDLALAVPIAKAIEQAQHFLWLTKGKPVFEGIKAGFKVKGISKAAYAPLALSTANFPFYKKVIHHARHTRPKWYKTYHSYPITRYFHFAILIIFMSAIGYAFYNSFAQKPSQDPAVLAAVLPQSPPRIFSFQGRLTDSSDNPITSATDLRFGIYDHVTASGSALKWQEVNNVTPDADGIFSILLGQKSALSQSMFINHAGLWLGVTVDKTPELTPRQQLAAVAFAENSDLLQGLPPITQTNAGTTNVVLALDSSGNLTIGGTATPTFQASGGRFTLSGNPLLLTTNAGSNGNVQLAPNGTGFIDLQKPAQNSTNNNNIATARGALEVNDMFAVLATSSGQSAFTLDQNGIGPIISASASGVQKFTVDNGGNTTISGNFLSTLTASRDLGSSSVRWNNLWVQTINATGTNTSGQASFTYDPADTTFAQSTVLINPTSAGPNESLLGLGVGGVERARIDTEGDLAIGFAGGTLTPNANPLTVYNHGTTQIATIDASGNSYFAGNMGIGTTNPSSFKLQAAGNIGPDASNTYDLGSGSLFWKDFYLGSRMLIGSNSVNVAQAGNISLLNFDGGNNAVNIGAPSGTINTEFTTITLRGTTHTSNLGSGTLANDRFALINQSTFAGTGVTVTNATTLAIAGAPTASAGTLTNSSALRISAGALTNTTNGYGLYVDAPTGATNNYAATFATGNVGIGTTGPTNKLTVSGGDIRLDNTRNLNFRDAANTTDWNILSVNSANSTTLYGPAFLNLNSSSNQIRANANTIISASSGLNPASMLDVVGGISIGTYGGANAAPSNGLIVSGNVGIGTTSPSTFKLEVAGNIGPEADNTRDLGSSSRRWANIYANNISSSGSITATGNILPAADDTYDLGSSALRWRDLYLGPTSLRLLSTAAETGTARQYRLAIQETAGVSQGNFRIWDGTTDFVNINPSGNVGIGTTSPGSKLHVGDGTGSQTVTIDAAATGQVGLQWNQAGVKQWLLRTPGATRLQLEDAAGTPVIAVLQGGNVGIGTTNPGVLLDLSQSASGNQIRFATTGGSGAGRQWTLSAWNTPNSFSIDESGVDRRLTILPGGNVGIGTTSPNNLGNGGTNTTLEVFKASGQGYLSLTSDLTADNSILGVLNFGTSGASTGKSAGSIQMELEGLGTTNASGNMRFYTRNGTTFGERMVIQYDGNVGIGTTSPSVKLQVAQAAGTNVEGLRLQSNTNSAEGNSVRLAFSSQIALDSVQRVNAAIDALTTSVTSSHHGELAFYTMNSTTLGERMRINNTGNVGIGTTSPQAALDVRSQANIGGVGAQGTLKIYASSASGTGAFGLISMDNSTLGRMTISAGGGSASTENSLAISASTIPGVDNTYVLGTTSLRWSSLRVGTSDSSFAGNVGIGTTGPGKLLHIAGTDPTFRIEETQVGQLRTWDFQANDNKLVIQDITAGQTRIAIDSSGNVGIGTTGPTSQLHLGSGALGALNTVDGLAFGYSAAINYIQATRSGNNHGEIILRALNTGSANANQLYLSYTGNVGIGVNPATILHTQSATPRVVVSHSTGELGLDALMGEVVFGTPSNTFTGTHTADAAIKAFSGATQSGTNHASYLTFFTKPTSLGPGSAALERMRIDSAGNVGIGTTGPSSTLNVSGSMELESGGTGNIDYRWTVTGPTADFDTMYLVGETTSGTNTFPQGYGDGNQIMSFKAKGENEVGIGYDAGATAHTAKLSVNGNVGIGTTAPAQMLHVNGGLLRVAANGGYLDIGSQNTSYTHFVTGGGPFWFNTNVVVQGNVSNYAGNFAISQSGNSYFNGGNVGIGTTGPGRTLDVVGNWGGNGVVDDVTVTASSTRTLSTKALVYYVASTCNAAVPAVTTTFNITGLPNTDGTFAFISSRATGTCNTNGHDVIVQINGVQVSSVSSPAGTTIENYTVVRANSAWRVLGTSGSDAADLAEWIKFTGEKPAPGDLVSVADQKETVRISQHAYDSKLIGVISTAPAIKIGPESDDSVLLALAGRVPTKVTTENGTIKPGDYLTSSATKPGYAMKATRAGQVIGVALESFDPAPCTKTSDFGLIEQTACEGKIVVFVNTIYYDPNPAIITTIEKAKEYVIEKAKSEAELIASGSYIVKNALGETATQAQILASAVIGNLRVGLIEAQAIIADRIQTTEFTSPLARIKIIETNVITNKDKNKIVIKLENKDASDSAKPTLEIQNASGSAVATIDDSGNASFSGQLSSSSLSTDEATVSGTLRTKNLIADNIGSEISNLKSQISNLVPPITNDQLPITDAIASYSAQLAYVDTLHAVTGMFTGGFSSLGPSLLTDLSVFGQLSVGANLVLADNSINVLGEDFEIQPLGQGGVSFLAGKVYIDVNGNMTVNGDATFNGNLFARVISPIPGSDLAIKLATESGRFAIQNASGSAVATIDLFGDGTFRKLKLNFVSPVLALSEHEVIATGSAGIATISATFKELTIKNTLVTDKSLIYVSPVGSPSGQIPFLIRQKPNESFTIGVENTLLKDLPFNWLIIN